MDDGRTYEAVSTAEVMASRAPLAIALLGAAVLGACFPSHEIAKRSRAVIVSERAKNVEYSVIGPEESIAYDLAPPPTIDVTRQLIDRELRTDGWRADALEAPRSVVDVRKGRREPVEQWRGTWRRGQDVAEYILERRPDRLHVWGRVGPPDHARDTSTGVIMNPDAASEPISGAETIAVGPNDVVVFCGAQGAAAVALTNVTDTSAVAAWQFRDLAGHESSAEATVREHPGARPNEIDATGAHFRAGPYAFTWSPAEVTMTGSRTKPQSVVTARSWIYYPSNTRATKFTGTSLGTLNLSTACR
jgi:hypothetical protein